MNVFRSAAGSTARLVFYALSYFALYTLFGFGVKFAQSPAAEGFPGLSDLDFLVYSTAGSAVLCLGVILIFQWWRFAWQRAEVFFMVVSGFFTALVIPTTTLMYSLPISVMVAMVIMRGSIIVVTRLVDSLLLFQGLSHKKVRWEENLAVIISLCAVGTSLLVAKGSDFDFVHSAAATGILTTYIVAYSLRLYLMNLFKFTRGPGKGASNKNYFAIEQLSASVWIFGFLGFLLVYPDIPSLAPANLLPSLEIFVNAVRHPPASWLWAVVIGLPFGISAFFSVFLFMFEGRTSTFSGLVNRLASLLAGTFSTLLFALIFGGKWPKPMDWVSFALILVAVYFLWSAEMKKKQESR